MRKMFSKPAVYGNHAMITWFLLGALISETQTEKEDETSPPTEMVSDEESTVETGKCYI